MAELDQLAAQLGRPPTSLSAFRALSPEQYALLSDAIDAARARRRRSLDEALAKSMPAASRRLLLAALRARRP
jgi:hypothetical protein